jgi:hypothetical protein
MIASSAYPVNQRACETISVAEEWLPIGDSTPPSGIPNTTGVYAQGQWGSFPNDGENLGLPNGLRIPLPTLGGLLGFPDQGIGCDFGVCGNGFAATATLPYVVPCLSNSRGIRVPRFPFAVACGRWARPARRESPVAFVPPSGGVMIRSVGPR